MILTASGQGTDSWLQERLYRAMASSSWLQLFSDTMVSTLETTCSNHLLLLLSLFGNLLVPFPKRFCFENFWANEEGCKLTVQESWISDDHVSITTKIEQCCTAIQN